MSIDSPRPLDAAPPATRAAGRAPLLALVARLHFYVGLFVGPFIFVAALTGTLFVLTPQIETRLYADQLLNDSSGPPRPLAEQIAAARAHLAQDSGLPAAGADAVLAVVRPSQGQGWNTRVMFSAPGLAVGEHLTVFVDPVTLAPKGELVAYGTSGTLPFRTGLDHLHRDLMLGGLGRHYSELAASWLWLAVLGGVALWATGGVRNRARHAARSPRLRARRLHGLIGLALALGLLFFSATGLTWSKWAGGRIDTLRTHMGWVTPPLDTRLPAGGPTASAGHAEHADHPSHATHAAHADHSEHADHLGHHHPDHGRAPAVWATDGPADARFDAVLAAARQAGIDSPQVEIRAARTPEQAWVVREYDRSWPTQVDTVAVDPGTLAIVGRADFETFPLVAKLIRWGIDAHMGILFGVVNQIVVAALGLGLCLMIGLGYRMWWLRRPVAAPAMSALVPAWRALPRGQQALVAAVALALGWSLPVLGASLIVLLGIDAVRWHAARTREHARA